MACGQEVTRKDAKSVMGRLESMARASTHGGYDSRMTSDPILVSRAIFEWWWVEKDQRGEFYRRIKAGQQAAAVGDQMNLAMEVVKRHEESLDMDDVRLDEPSRASSESR